MSQRYKNNTYSYTYNLKNITSKANEVRKLCLLNNAVSRTDATVNEQQTTEL